MKKMRIVIIDDCEYSRYEEIRDRIIKEIPFTIVNDMYSKKHKRAIFNFWDSHYIFDDLKEYVFGPSKNSIKVKI